ncbi:MAG: methyltransferase [Verrucomicrobia bacterium]|nr:methyltransferase [Verrucomicrobiota bacterium]
MDFIEALRKLVADLGIRQGIPTAAFSADDDPGRPDKALIELALSAARSAAESDLSDLCRRLAGPPYWPEIWPGEHYKLLAGLVRVLQPKLAIEIGTATGLSALAIRKFLPATSRLATFDIIPWTEFPGHVLTPADFHDGRLQQIVADLSDLSVARTHGAVLNNADFLFIDAAKDGRVEPALLGNLAAVGLKEGAVLVFDDIRMMTMLPLWRSIALPKLDLTSFGHWSGTGLTFWRRSVPWFARRKAPA